MAKDWRHDAACRNEDPELFFPVGISGPALRQIEQAKAVCRRCPVRDECLEWALRTGQDAGIWGGMTEDERRALKRRNARIDARSAWQKVKIMARYEVDCRDCSDELGSTNDPREAYGIAHETTDHEPRVTARGLINRVRYDRANRDRG